MIKHATSRILGTATVAMATALLLGATAGCSAPAEESAAPARVIEAQPYKLDSSLDSALRFFRNDNVFEATVTEVLPDVHAVDKMDSGQTFEAVYTPVKLVVDEVYRGDLKVGSEIIVRSMGGEANGLRYVIHDAPDKATFSLKAKVVIFGAEYSTVDSESVPAITPNFVYHQSGALFVDATYADGAANGAATDQVTATEMRTKLRGLPRTAIG